MWRSVLYVASMAAWYVWFRWVCSVAEWPNFDVNFEIKSGVRKESIRKTCFSFSVFFIYKQKFSYVFHHLSAIARRCTTRNLMAKQQKLAPDQPRKHWSYRLSHCSCCWLGMSVYLSLTVSLRAHRWQLLFDNVRVHDMHVVQIHIVFLNAKYVEWTSSEHAE